MTTTLRVPFDVGPTGRLGFADTDYDVANQYLKVLLLTRLTERVMRPNYGSRVRDSVFGAVSEEFAQVLEGDIRDAVRDWEPAVELRVVDIDISSGSTVEVDVQYTLGSTIGLPPSTLRVSIDVGGDVEEQQ